MEKIRQLSTTMRGSVAKMRGTIVARAIAAASLIAGAGFAVATATPAHAALNDITVVNHADDGSPTSLRGVIDTINADGGDWRVTLEPNVAYVVNRQCQSGDPNDNHGGDLDIVTNGNVEFQAEFLQQATITVMCAGERAVDHYGTGVLHLENVRITGGNTAPGANGDPAGDRNGHNAEGGGAVRSNGKVELVNVQLDTNSTGRGGSGAPVLVGLGPGGNGGAAGSGGAVQALDLTIERSKIFNNTTGRGGNAANGVGAGQPGGNGGDGGIGTIVANTVVIERTEVTDNVLGAGGNGGGGLSGQGGNGGAGGHGAGVFALTATIDASTLASNTAGAGGQGGSGNGAVGGNGGGGGQGGGIRASNATITRSTVHANTAGAGGAAGGGTPAGQNGLISAGGGVRITLGGEIVFSTITANVAAFGSNLYVPPALAFVASVEGEAQGGGNSCNNAVTNLRFSAHDSATCGGDPTLVFSSLGLGPLTDNGGLTRTRLPMLTSPLAGLIPDDVCPSISQLTADQRDYQRPNWRCEPGAVELPNPAASRFVPLPPARVFDTRQPGPAGGFVAAGTTRTVQFAGVAGIPTSNVTAVVFNLTIDAAGGAGFVTVFGHGTPRPLASSLNTVRAGQTVPNLVIVPLGDGGQLDFFAQRGGQLIGDVVGYFERASVATAGRTLSIAPARLFDTREPGPASGKLAPGATLTVDVTGIAGVPQSGVAAVVINLTGTEATGAGYVTAFPGGQPRPLASTLNLEGSGHTAANLTIVPVGLDGTISFYSQSGVHLLADVTAFITDGTASVGAQGLFVPQNPQRVFDTRDSASPIAPGGTINVNAVVGDPGTTPVAVWLNLTATEAAGPGFVTGWAKGHTQPLASNLNLTFAGETRANAALLSIGSGIQVSFFSQSGTHLLADVYGYLLPASEFVLF